VKTALIVVGVVGVAGVLGLIYWGVTRQRKAAKQDLEKVVSTARRDALNDIERRAERTVNRIWRGAQDLIGP